MNLTSDYINYPVDGYHVEFGKGKKKRIVVDACCFEAKDGSDVVYEVAALRGDGSELDMYRTQDYQDMKAAYSRMVRAYCPEEYKALLLDLKTAKEIALAVNCDDGGTCNFDAPSMEIPKGLSADSMKGLCNSLDLCCHTWKPFGKGPAEMVLSGASGRGQGYRRTKGAEAACSYLRDKGYTVGMYYQMD